MKRSRAEHNLERWRKRRFLRRRSWRSKARRPILATLAATRFGSVPPPLREGIQALRELQIGFCERHCVNSLSYCLSVAAFELVVLTRQLSHFSGVACADELVPAEAVEPTSFAPETISALAEEVAELSAPASCSPIVCSCKQSSPSAAICACLLGKHGSSDEIRS